MSIPAPFSRVTSYFARHGLAATIRRASLFAKRAIFARRMVLFYCDLPKQTGTAIHLADSMQMDRLTHFAELNPQDLHAMTSFWNPPQATGDIQERFQQKAALWMIKYDQNLAGYGWTLQGRTIEPHYFPLAPDDVHLFDFHVFAQYRGQGINPLLVNLILRNMADESAGRAFIEAAEWNEAQLSSLRKTPFRRLGLAWKSAIFRRPIVYWAHDEAIPNDGKGAALQGKISPVARPHER